MGWNIAGEGGNAFSFENPGDQVTGKIKNLEEVQQTDIKDNTPLFWDNGQPKMMYRVTLQTELRDPSNPDDDGHRDIYLRGSRKQGCKSSLAAVLDAVRAATGGTELEPGGVLTMQYTGDGVPSQRGFNAPKQYAASYQRPAMNLGAPAAAPTPTAAPAAAPAPQAQQLPPAPAPAPAAAGPTAEQVAALKAMGIDPATVYPSYVG